MKKRTINFLLIILVLAGCAYYNTFFNAEQYYQEGITKKNNTSADKIPPDVIKSFNSAIAKCWKVIQVYGDSSSYADDALLMIGKCHYQIEEYAKSEEILQQFLQKYLRSPFIPEAQLWLGKDYIKLNKTDDALDILNELIKNTDDDQIRAEAHYNLGQLYYEQEDYESAISNFTNCLKYSSNSETSGNAQFMLGKAYFDQKDYQQAIDNFEKVLHYDLPILKQYDAIVQRADAMLELSQLSQTEDMLKNILHDQRFKSYYSMIAAKLANIYEFQKEYSYAIDKYREVIKTYPKSEGAALSDFYIGQIYEFEMGQYDSAKVHYDQVRKEYSKSESVEDAQKRSKILGEYLKIHDQLIKDRNDIYKLEHGDSSLVDSMVTGVDTISYVVRDTTSKSPEQINQDSLKTENNVFNNPFANRGRRIDELGKIDSLQQIKKVKTTKVAISRKPQEVESSMLKNSFALGEYFLLNYQQYDSAEAAYFRFVNNFNDSLLSPKAYYSLYFILKTKKEDNAAADSIKQIILSKYPETVYGQKLSKKDHTKKVKSADDVAHVDYLAAESLMAQDKYKLAISAFNKIADENPTSHWAILARYAAAYISEKYLKNTDEAVTLYTKLADEYPDSKQGKIAIKKIAEPPKEALVDSVKSDSTITAPDSSRTPLPINKREEKRHIEPKPERKNSRFHEKPVVNDSSAILPDTSRSTPLPK